MFKNESNDSKIFDDIQKIVEISCNNDEISLEYQENVSFISQNYF